MKPYTSRAIRSVFNSMSRLNVFVVGDAMLDNYWMGSIDRISPEAPVPVMCIQEKESRLGGAANVALNCKALGAKVSLLSVLGHDANARLMMALLEEAGIDTSFCIQSKKRQTTTKTRLIARKQQAMRIDEEITSDLETRDEHHFIDTCLRAIQIEKPDILIFEDYNKGVLTQLVISKIIEHCRVVGVLTAVDPKLKNFFTYKGVDLFKPNLKEVKEACALPKLETGKSSMKDVHELLHARLGHKATMVTLSEKGVFVQEDKKNGVLPAHIREIADVSGAGDTVIAVGSMVYSITQDIFLAAHLANLAGGLVCEEPGVVPVRKSKLLQEAVKTGKRN